MKQNELRPPVRAVRARKRVGRGNGSGHGNYSGRGMKGQNSRSGGGVRLGFEGGQNPIAKALPSLRGFTNIFRKQFAVVNLHDLSHFQSGTEVTPELMAESGTIKNTKIPVKILARGELNIPLVVLAHKFSRSARRKIEAAGGSVVEVR